MTSQRRGHPRAGLAIGALVLGGWLAALGVAIANDGTSDRESGAVPGSPSADAPVARPGRAGPGYLPSE
jgi:hypothetical protein